MRLCQQQTPLFFALILNLFFFVDSTLPKVRPVPNLIDADGFPVEVHHVKTPDGYLIELHRIPPKGQLRPAPVALMPHCFLCSSAAYVVLGPGKALGYLLHESGYDVWMINARGNSYSLNHTTYSQSDPEFWSFSYHEIAVYDLSSSMDYVLESTGQTSVDIVAYSMGTLVSFIALAELPDFKTKVRRMAALAPVAYVSHIDLLSLELAQILMQGPEFRRTNFVFPPREWRINSLFYSLCSYGSFFRATVCPHLLDMAIKAKVTHTEVKNLDFFFLYVPDYTSIRLAEHFLQVKNSGIFRRYDHGYMENLKVYGSPEPPVYNLSRIDTPIAFFSSKWDTLSTPEDIRRLEDELPNVVSHYKVPLYDFSHVDFIMGKNVHKELYSRVIDFLFL